MQEMPLLTSSLLAGGYSAITVDNWKPRYLDEYTQEILPQHLVQEAMLDEIKYFADHVVEITDTDKIHDYEDAKNWAAGG